jgi:hypothetical protein
MDGIRWVWSRRTLKLLDCLCACAEDETAKGFCAVGLVPADEVSPADGVLAFIVDAVFDFVILGSDIRVVRGFSFNACKYLDGFLVMAVGQEPSSSSLELIFWYL